jgi:hypothetical protein
MQFIRAASVGASLALSLTLSAVSRPAEAGKVCSKAGLSSPCVTGSDMKPSIVLGGSGDNGRFRIRGSNNAVGVDLLYNGNLTNLFSNSASKSNGLVKAWAQVNADGTVESCWRCNKDPTQTHRLDVGIYEVDFTPLSTNISGRPRTATSDAFSLEVPPATIASITHSLGDESSVFVVTIDAFLPELIDSPFVLMIY